MSISRLQFAQVMDPASKRPADDGFEKRPPACARRSDAYADVEF